MAKTQRFLAPNTRLVVGTRDYPRWHTTSKEVPIDVEPMETVCPMTGNRVRSIVYEGYTLYFPPNIVRTREVFEEGDLDRETIAVMKPVLFTYDIPDDATEIVRGRERPFYNPSDQLRRFAVRLNLSCWVLNEGDVPHALIARMLDAGCNPYVFAFDPKEAEKLVGMAVASLRNEINAAISRANLARARAEEQLNNALDEEGVTAEQAERRYLERANGISARLQVLTNDLNLVASRFGITPGVLNTDRLTITGDTLKTQMIERAEAYAKAMKDLRNTGSEAATDLANTAASETVPPGIVADMLMDEGKNEEAEALKKAFGIETPAPVEVPPTEDDGTFSLVGNDDQYEPGI